MELVDAVFTKYVAGTEEKYVNLICERLFLGAMYIDPRMSTLWAYFEILAVLLAFLKFKKKLGRKEQGA